MSEIMSVIKDGIDLQYKTIEMLLSSVELPSHIKAHLRENAKMVRNSVWLAVQELIKE